MSLMGHACTVFTWLLNLYNMLNIYSPTLLLSWINAWLSPSLPVLCAKNLVKKDFFRKYLPITSVYYEVIFAFHTLFVFPSWFCRCMYYKGLSGLRHAGLMKCLLLACASPPLVIEPFAQMWMVSSICPKSVVYKVPCLLTQKCTMLFLTFYIFNKVASLFLGAVCNDVGQNKTKIQWI